jgi:hypothetical protein
MSGAWPEDRVLRVTDEFPGESSGPRIVHEVADRSLELDEAQFVEHVTEAARCVIEGRPDDYRDEVYIGPVPGSVDEGHIFGADFAGEDEALL